MTTTKPAFAHDSNDRLKFYHDLVETSQDLIFQCDVQGRFTFLNPAWEAATGYTVEELLGRKFTDFIAPGMLEGIMREFARVILGGSFKGHETAFTGKKQELIYLNFNAKVVRDENGGVFGAQGTAHDITPFKLAEKARQGSEEKYRKIFENTAEGIFQVTPDGRLLSANPALARSLGYESVEELTGAVGDIGTQIYKNAEERERMREALVKNGFVRNFMAECRKKDGSSVWIEFSAKLVRDNNGTILYHEGTGKDVTDRIQTEQRLIESEERFSKAFMVSPFPYAIVTAEDARIVEVNDAFLAIEGFSREEVLGLSTIKLGLWVDEKDRERMEAAIRTKGEVLGMETRLRSKNGNIRTVLFSARKIHIGNIPCILSINEDITIRKQAEQRLRESEDRFRKIIEQAPIAMAIVSMDGVIEYINRKAIDVFGYLLEDIPTMDRWWVRAYPDEKYRGEVIADWTGRIRRAVAENSEIAGNEYRVTCKDGSEKSMFIYGTPVSGKIFVMFDDITWRKQAEIALKRSEARYRHLVETTDTGYVIIDIKGSVIDANAEYVRLSGHKKAEEIIGRSVLEWTAETEKEKNAAAVAACMENGFVRDLELIYVDKTGKRTYVEINATMMLEEGNRNILSLCRDITERKRLEERQKQTASLLLATLESTADGILVVDTSGRVTSFNKKFGELWRIPRLLLDAGDDEKLLSYIVDQLKDPGRFIGKVKDLYSKPFQVGFDTVEFKDGRVFERYSQPQQIDDIVVGRVWSFRDCTERKHSEAALRESEQRYRLVSELAADYAYKLGIAADGKVTMTFISDNFYALTGRTRDDALTVEKWGSIIHPEDQGKVRALLKRLILNPQSAELECRSFGPARTLKWVNVIARSEWDEKENRVTAIVGAVKDITDRKRMEEDLQKTQKLESLGVLAGGIAHDFNNLLAGIFGYIDLARSVSKDPVAIGYLDTTLSSMNRARALTMQLLTFAKGGAPVQKATDLVPFIRETAQFALSGSNISCNFILAEDLRPCNIDKNQIGQVLDNIIINAQQAMPNGGSIEIAADNIALGEKEHPVLAAGEYVRISIKDSGIGIPKDVLPRIFDPFYTTKTKGHGLGLATSYSIIQRHAGYIGVDSEPGKGSTFHIHLPASSGQAAPPSVPVARHKGSGVILVMDDEEVIRTTFRKMLEPYGYTVAVRKDGREAVDLHASETTANRRFAAMIFDLTVPGGMGGIEAVAEIRKSDKDLPVFVASGYAENDAMKNPAQYGFTASLCKPFTIAELLEMLDKYVKKENE